MKNIKFLLLFFLIIIAYDSFASLRHKGAINVRTGDFYFTGYSLYVWSGRKPEFKDNYAIIYRYNFERRARETFFSASNCFFRDLTISPAENNIAVRCTQKETAISLMILNTEGKKVAAINEPVQGYAWYPDSTKIIYITGTVIYRGDEATINSTGVWLYDIKEETKIKIAEKGWNVRNTNFDRHIYFWNGEKTVRFNIDTQKTERTNIIEKADYSPDGRYYIHHLSAEAADAWEAPYWSPFRIFDTKEGKDLSPSKIGFMSERNPIGPVWSKDSNKIAFKGNVSRTDFNQTVYVYDLETNKVIKQLQGEIVGFSIDRTILVIYRDGEFYTEIMQ